MASLQLSGLASGMDWKTTVSQLMAIERIPQDKLKKKQSDAATRQEAIDTLKASLLNFQTAAKAMNLGSATTGTRTASVLSSQAITGDPTTGTYVTQAYAPTDTGVVSTESGATTGNFKISVLRTATPAVSYGMDNGIKPTTTGFDSLTLGDYGVTSGSTLTVNGTQLTVTSADVSASAKDFLTKIVNAAGGDPATDLVTNLNGSYALSIPSPAGSLGSLADSGNILAALGLSFQGQVNQALTYSQIIPPKPLGNLGLSSFVAAGTETFKINGVSISMNTSTQTLGSLVSAINGSNAGVTASIDAVRQRLVISSKTPGNSAISFTDSANGLLSSLGLGNGSFASQDPAYGAASGRTDITGNSLLYTVTKDGTPLQNTGLQNLGFSPSTHFNFASGTNDPTYASSVDNYVFASDTNTVDLSKHGFGASKLAVTQAGTYNVQIAGATTDGRAKIDAFISAYNSLRQQITDLTKVTVGTGGKVTTSVLSGNTDVSRLLSTVRSRIFTAVTDPGGTSSPAYADLSTSYNSLDKIGIGFDRSGTMSVQNASKLSAALLNYPAQVNALFNSGTNSLTATAAKGSNTITVSDATLLRAGQTLTGTGIPSGATISSISGNTVTLSASTTAALSSTAVNTPYTNQGVALRLDSLVSTITGNGGLVKAATTSISTETKALQNQIDAMERRLVAEQNRLTAGFVAMEEAQSKSQSMLQQLSNIK